MELSPEEKQKIYEEEKARIDSQQKTQAEIKAKNAIFQFIALAATGVALFTPKILASIPILTVLITSIVSLVRKEPRRFLSACLLGIGIIFMIASSPSISSIPSRGPDVKQEVQQSEGLPPLQILSWRCDKEHDYVFVRGEVKNISSQIIKNVTAVAEFRTKNGTFVKSEDALIKYNPILPGQTSPFEVGGTDNPEIEKCNVAFKDLLGGAIPHILAAK